MNQVGIWSGVAVLVCNLGCATILQPGPDRIKITSEPSVARVWVDGKIVGSTPMVAPVPRQGDGLIWVDVEGYERASIQLGKVVAGWTFANVLFPPGLIIDLLEENQGKYPDDPLHVDLKVDPLWGKPLDPKVEPVAPPVGEPSSP